jgi:hypothetical protein
MVIGPRYHNWTFEKLYENLRKKKGVDIDPASIKEYLKRNAVPLVGSPTSAKRGRANRHAAVSQKIEGQLDRDAKKAEQEGSFDPTNIGDGRQKVIRGINLRRGQVEFRKKLLEAYNRRCAITNCDCPDTLEAAHILPYCGADTNHVQNGILLRSDIHTLFDIGKIGIDPISHKVIVSKSLNGTDYEGLKREKLRLPLQSGNQPNDEVLRKTFGAVGIEIAIGTLTRSVSRVGARVC